MNASNHNNPLMNHILSAYSNALDMTQKIVLTGQLEHLHSTGRMKALYALSEKGQFGYAYLNQHEHISTFHIDQKANDLLKTYPTPSIQLAILDAIWNNPLTPDEKVLLTGKTPRCRNTIRNALIMKHLEKRPKTEPIVMIGFFSELYHLLMASGRKVYCSDADSAIHEPFEDDASKTLMIVSASYLTRTDYALIHQAINHCNYSLLLSQTCSNMIQMHLDFGFDLIVSEAFPTYSLSNSTISTYTA